jgi:hypothetical protein
MQGGSGWGAGCLRAVLGRGAATPCDSSLSRSRNLSRILAGFLSMTSSDSNFVLSRAPVIMCTHSAKVLERGGSFIP